MVLRGLERMTRVRVLAGGGISRGRRVIIASERPFVSALRLMGFVGVVAI
jgi:succinylarginine dihydrolase